LGRPGETRVATLIAFHHAGGGASFFSRLGVPPGLPIALQPVQLPGREDRWDEAPAASVQAAAEDAIERLPAGAHEPCLLYGHSLGALVAFEVAHLLGERHDEKPAALIVSAEPAPHLASAQRLTGLSDAEIWAEMSALGGVPAPLAESADFRTFFIGRVRADIGLYDNYVCRVRNPLGCPILAFGGLEDGSVSEHELLAWREHTTGAFSVTLLDGGHFFIVDAWETLLRAAATFAGEP
jgi:medium-chain acyl-[acyl-carrier-protein] hydrolase